MRWIVFCFVWLVSACAPTGPGDSADAPATTGNVSAGAGGWQTLFDGTDLSAFMLLGDANWTIEDGAVGADAGEGGHLVTNERYADFEFEVEFFVSPDANSGVFIRCDDPQNVTATSCYEVNIYDTRPDQTYRTGGVVNLVEPAAILYTGGRWNRYEIVADGTNLRAVLNGEEMYDVDDDTYADGHITLQFGSGVVKFRNARIRRL
jgi:hypothetical protein